MKLITIAILLSITLYAAAGIAGTEQVKLKDETDKVNYSLGYQIGEDFTRQKVELDAARFLQGVQDALSEKEPLLTPDERHTTLINLKKKIEADQRALSKKALEKYHEEDKKFLEENAKREGVTVLPSGLQYKILKKGTGKTPKAKDSVTAHFQGSLINGKIFGSTYRDNKPKTYTVDKLIPGLQEALQLMKEGGKWEVFIPPKLAFGKGGPVAERAVIYEVELLAVSPPEQEGSKKASQ